MGIERKQINEDILEDKRAEYGKQVVASVAEELSLKYGKSFQEKSICRMMQFAGVFDDEEIVATLW